MTPRDRETLRQVVGQFIATGAPVSSRAVARASREGLSAATIRNSMADLAEAGYLSQPHTSAGRVPTEAGYHLFIESLMPPSAVSHEERRYIDESLGNGHGDDLAAKASHLLSDLSHQIGIVLTPALGETKLKAVDFVPLSGRRVLCVVVSMDGFIDNKVIETSQALSREDLVRIGNYLSESFAGMTLREARDRLLTLMAEERARVDALLANAIALAQGALGADAPNLLVEGTSIVLGQPELSDLDRVKRLVETFNNKALLVRMLGQLIDGQGVRVVIGGESDLTSDLDFSLVATPYGGGENQPYGTLGIFGPSRMPYQRVIPLVTYLGERLSRALESTLE
ncbi:MAG: heat-inducible transcriptional repressor HrcA [Thermoanaerobaculia bacterium]